MRKRPERANPSFLDDRRQLMRCKRQQKSLPPDLREGRLPELLMCNMKMDPVKDLTSLRTARQGSDGSCEGSDLNADSPTKHTYATVKLLCRLQSQCLLYILLRYRPL